MHVHNADTGIIPLLLIHCHLDRVLRRSPERVLAARLKIVAVPIVGGEIIGVRPMRVDAEFLTHVIGVLSEVVRGGFEANEGFWDWEDGLWFVDGGGAGQRAEKDDGEDGGKMHVALERKDVVRRGWGRGRREKVVNMFLKSETQHASALEFCNQRFVSQISFRVP